MIQNGFADLADINPDLVFHTIVDMLAAINGHSSVRKQLAGTHAMPNGVIGTSTVKSPRADQLKWSSGSGEMVDSDSSEDENAQHQPSSASRRGSKKTRTEVENQRGPIAELLYARWLEVCLYSRIHNYMFAVSNKIR